MLHTNLTPEQLDKLPKYAQREIERLSANAEWYQKKAEVGPEDSDTFADAFAPGEGKPLGRGTRVLFHHGPDERDTVTVRVLDGQVEIHGYSTLHVTPRASNLLHVRSVS